MKTHTLECKKWAGVWTGEWIDFSVVGIVVIIEWRCEYQCGTQEKQPIDLAAWELGNLGVFQREDGHYSIEKARLIWNALVQNKGCKVAQ
jgi:hypothetical protein